jgi:hypothetical protein
MKNVAICSLMRAGSEYEQAYYLQILGLARRIFKLQSVNVVYDAEPAASAWLRELLASQGVPVYYEIEDAPAGDGGQFASRLSQRQAPIAWRRPDPSCLGRSSVSYPYDTMEALLAHDKPIIAPWIYLNSVFYDSWGFRDKNGSRITSIEPYFPDAPHEPIELSSVGSYVLFDIAIFRSNIRFRADYDHGLLIGICQEAAKIGFKTFVDPAVSILHPVSAWRKQLWSCRRLQVFAKGVLKFDTPTPGAVFGEAYEELIRPWLDQWLGPVYGSGGTRRISIRRYPGEKTFDVRVDFDSSPGS